MMNLLKKLAACGLSLTMILSLAACGGTDDTTADDCYIIHCSFPPVSSSLTHGDPGVLVCTKKKEQTESKATALVRFAHIS